MYKLIALDLDGTLLNDNKILSKENKEIIDKLVVAGYEVVIATGRSYYSARYLTENLNHKLVYLANNGNIVRDSKNERVLIYKYLNTEDFYLVVEEGEKYGIHPVIHVDYYSEGYDLIFLNTNKFKDNYYKNPKNVIRHREILDYKDPIIDRILAIVYPGDKNTLLNFQYKILEKYPEKFSTHVMENVHLEEALFEVMNPLGSKWKSLREYSEKKGIKAEEIIAVGDDNNDLEMILNAGLGIAMKNGNSIIKEGANIITEKDNNNSGVAFELKRVLSL